MKDRIAKFLKAENISSSKFADEIGVQRSSISHIIAGRNNPSLELIQKILNRFDKINPDWLILGKGEMYRPGKGIPTLFDQGFVETPVNSKILKPEEVIEPIKVEQKVDNKIDNSNFSTEPKINNPVKIKAVDRMFIIYNDGTFETYSPSN
ncbi:MAG: helix-turn-helix transcriptional regulator [Bacteroidia bacterium]|nr:helix-turn-helix transcriptional regulator [Bacteroidia bacterium]